MFSDSRGALMRRHKFKVSTLQKKCKKEKPSENIELTGKPFEASAQKKEQKKILDLAQINQLNARVLKAINYHFSCHQYDLYCKTSKTI